MAIMDLKRYRCMTCSSYGYMNLVPLQDAWYMTGRQIDTHHHISFNLKEKEE